MSSKTPGSWHDKILWPRGEFIYLRSNVCAVRRVFRPSFSDKNVIFELVNVLLFARCMVKQIVCVCVEKVSCQHNCIRSGVSLCVYVWECSYIFYEIYAELSVFRWQMVHMCGTFSKYSTCLLKGGQEVQVEPSWLIYIVQIIGNMGKNPLDLPWFFLFYLLFWGL